MKKIILINFGAVVLLCVCLAPGVKYLAAWQVTDIAEIAVGDSGYTVSFQEIGESFLSGSAVVKVSLIDPRGKTTETFRDRIENGGEKLSEDNIEVVPHKKCVKIILKGAEQEDKLYALCLEK